MFSLVYEGRGQDIYCRQKRLKEKKDFDYFLIFSIINNVNKYYEYYLRF